MKCGVHCMFKDKFVKTCNLGCGAAIPWNVTLPRVEMNTPQRPLQYCSANYKGPIGGKSLLTIMGHLTTVRTGRSMVTAM